MNALRLVLCAVVVAALLPSHSVAAQRPFTVKPTESGGPLMAEQAAFDVVFYDLAVRIDPKTESIAGTLTMRAKIVIPTEWIVLDLDTPLVVDGVSLIQGWDNPVLLNFERKEGKIWIGLGATRQPGEWVEVRVAYGGKPRVAPHPPWVGGFSWSKTASGAPWISVSCQSDGADIWWPCKDHPSDEPDEMAIHITVPAGLDCASNGTLRRTSDNADGTRTFDWYVSTPINNYDVSVNIAPYEKLTATFKSVSGQSIPVTFWALPESADKARKLVTEFLDYARFLEEYLGPYPFRADKIGIAEVSYLGMEHQTVTAYGANYRKNDAGFDGLLFHEFGHEWWGNLVTASDWRDMWIHEGFQSFMDALYVERLKGAKAYRDDMTQRRKHTRNKQPIGPRESRTTTQIYLVAPDYLEGDGDIYGKGSVVLDTLRYLIGDEAFFKFLRRMAYPTPAMERVTSGKQCRFATTDDVLRTAEEASGMELDWFFEVYTRQPALPRLVTEKTAQGLTLRWEAPGGVAFPMPVEVSVGGKMRRVAMTSGTAVVEADAVVDPDNRLFKAE